MDLDRAAKDIVASSNHDLSMEAVNRHYLQGSTIKEIMVMPDSRDGKVVAIVVPDLDHFRETGETDIHGEVEWEIEFYSQQLPLHKRIRDFVLINRALPKNKLGKINAYEIAALYRHLTENRHQKRRSALAEGAISEIGVRVVRLLQKKTESELIALDDHLSVDLGLDSLALVELILALEETFVIRIRNEELIGIFTVAELIRFVEGKQPHGFKELEGNELNWGKILQSPPPIDILKLIVVEESVQGRLFNLGFSLWLRFLSKLFFSLQIYGLERLGMGSCILCPNHGSFLDGFLLFSAVPQALRSRLYFLGYNHYFKGPVIRNIAKFMHVVPVNSARHLIPAMQASTYILNRGGVLGVFPEGARTLTGELRSFKKGVAILTKKVDIPLVPIYINGSYQAWGPNARFPRPYPIQIIFGRQFSADILAAKGWEIQPGVQTYEAIIYGLRQEVLDLRDELRYLNIEK